MSKRGKNQIVAPKPIPADMRGWVNEVLGVYSLLQRFDNASYQANQIWVARQNKYWKLRFAKLMTTPPDIPSRWYWKRIVSEILSKRHGQGRHPKEWVVKNQDGAE